MSAGLESPAAAAAIGAAMPPTDLGNPDYFHKVVDCQWACPAHTPVPEYIRLIAAGRYGGAYLVNVRAHTFSGVLCSARTSRSGKLVVVRGGGNTAMDCCRSSKRLGGEDVQVVVRSGFDEMKASPWEKEDAAHEGIPIHNYLVPKAFTHEGGNLTGVTFEKVAPQKDEKGRRKLVPTGEPDVHFPCDDVLVAIGQENAFPWIERDLGLQFDDYRMPIVDQTTMASTLPGVFFGGDAAFGPKNIIWAVAHGKAAAISIDL